MVRDFVTASFLKEILVSDIISQIGHVISLSRQDPKSMIVSGGQGTQVVDPLQTEREIYLDRVDFLRRLLKVEPETVKLRPMMDFVAHGNFFLPVVVGTAPFPAHPFFLWLFLTVAALAKISLKTPSGVQRVANIIQSTPNDRLYEAVRRENLELWQRRVTAGKSPTRLLEYLIRNKNTEVSRMVRSFNRALSPPQLYDLYNLDYSPAPASGSVEKVHFRLDDILEQAISIFRQRIGGAYNPLVISVSNMFFPKGSDFDYFSVREELDTTLESRFRRWLGEHVEDAIVAAGRRLAEKGSDVDVVVRAARKMDESIDKTDRDFEERVAAVGISHPIFDLNELLGFLSVVRVQTDSLRTKIRELLGFLAVFDPGAQHRQLQLKGLSEEVSSTYLMRHMNAGKDLDVKSFAVLGTIEKADEKSLELFFRDVHKVLVDVFVYLLLSSLVKAICQNIDSLRWNYRLHRVAATVFPNFTIALNGQLLRAISAILAYRNFFDFLSGSGKGERPGLMDRSPKVVVAYLSDNLEIPNIVVVDQNRICYRFMYLNQVREVSLEAAKNFVEFVNAGSQ